MSDANLNSGEQSGVEENQEHLDNREQDQIADDKVIIPKADFEKIKKQLKTANSEAKERREQLERYKGLGLEPDEIEELVSLRDKQGSDDENSDNNDRVDRKELDKQRKSLEQKYKADLEAKDKEISKMQKRLETTLIESTAREAIVAEKGVPDLILGQVIKDAQLFANDRGGYDVRVVDEDGNVEFNDKGEYMTISDKVKSLKSHEVFGRAFDAVVKQGAGMQSQQGNRRPKTTVTKEDLNKDRKAKMKFIQDNGFEAYNKLP